MNAFLEDEEDVSDDRVIAKSWIETKLGELAEGELEVDSLDSVPSKKEDSRDDTDLGAI